MKRPEQDLQRACVTWFKYQYPKGIIHHSPNGGKRGKIEAAIFKSLGVLAGWPDLVCVHDGRILFVELKSGNGKESMAQAIVRISMLKNGFEVHLCRTLNEFIQLVNSKFNG